MTCALLGEGIRWRAAVRQPPTSDTVAGGEECRWHFLELLVVVPGMRCALLAEEEEQAAAGGGGATRAPGGRRRSPASSSAGQQAAAAAGCRRRRALLLGLFY